jgi:Tfp pilus assembly protein PilN
MNLDFPELRRLLAIGTGVGIEIDDDVLRVAAVRVRPGGARLLGSATINGFRERTAAGWGAVCTDFLKRTGASHLAATVLLPRSDVIVRVLALPGVRDQDIASAIDLQIDSMHPFPEEQSTYAWTRLGGGGAVLVAITRKDALERYFAMFSEAGVKVAAFTFSAAVLYSASRLLTRPPAGGFLAFATAGEGLEAYGESEARPVFSAAFDVPRDRAAELASAELRLAAGVEPIDAAALLPSPGGAPTDFDLSRNALAYAAALAGACPRLALPLNLLPAENRSSNSRAIYVPTVVLLAAALLCVAALASIAPVKDREYLRALEAETVRLEPQARKAGEIDRSIEATRAKTKQLDDFRRRSKGALDALAEVNKLIDPPAYLTNLDLAPDSITIAGSAEHAEPLLKVFDSSPLFQASEFTIPLSPNGTMQVFRIRAARKGVPK